MLDSSNKIYGYARVSTNKQHIDRQTEALQEYVSDPRDIIIDKQSGKDFNREGYLLLRNVLLRSGDTLVIKELDRLGRNKQQIKEELEYFKDKGIRVKILNIPTSLVDFPKGNEWIQELVTNILIEVLSSIAEQERLNIRQRQAEGIMAARNRGIQFGRPAIEPPENFGTILKDITDGKLTAVEAMKQLDMKKTSFYKLRREYLEKEAAL